jgi:hypothetical protein
MANQKISDIYAANSKSSLSGLEQVEINDAGTTKGTLTGNIAALANNISGTDHDIGAGNETASISTLTALGAGTIARYSWYDGDGTFTFSFTGTAGITIDGIASSEYVGEGTGHLDLFVVSASVCITINRGEIWDSDGGNFSGETFEKYLTGIQKTLDAYSLSAYPTSNNFVIAYAAAPQITKNGYFTGQVNYTVYSAPQSTTATDVYVLRSNVETQITSGSGKINHVGRWTTSYPRIT